MSCAQFRQQNCYQYTKSNNQKVSSEALMVVVTSKYCRTHAEQFCIVTLNKLINEEWQKIQQSYFLS